MVKKCWKPQLIDLGLQIDQRSNSVKPYIQNLRPNYTVNVSFQARFRNLIPGLQHAINTKPI